MLNLNANNNNKSNYNLKLSTLFYTFSEEFDINNPSLLGNYLYFYIYFNSEKYKKISQHNWQPVANELKIQDKALTLLELFLKNNFELFKETLWKLKFNSDWKILSEEEQLSDNLKTDIDNYLLSDYFFKYQRLFNNIFSPQIEKEHSLGLNSRETLTFEEYWKNKEEKAKKFKAESGKTENIKPKEESIDKKTDSKLNKTEEPKPKHDKKPREGGDRHKDHYGVRYREDKLIEYLKSFNLIQVKNPNLNEKNFHIKFDLWNKFITSNSWWRHFFPNHTIIKKSFFFSFDSRIGTILSQKDWLIIVTTKQRRKSLVEAIQSENPFKFKKLLTEIETDVNWTIKWLKINPFNILETRNKIAQKKGFNEPNYKELQKVSTLLSCNGEFSIKMVNGFFTLDSDAYKKEPELKKAIENALEMMMNYLKINTYGLSARGGWHLFFRCLEAIGNFTVYYNKFKGDNKFIKFGDLQGQGKYIVSPLSKGRKLARRGKKWKNKKAPDEIFVFKDKAQMIKIFAKFGFYLSESKEVNDWKNYKKYKDSVNSSEKIVNYYENYESLLENKDINLKNYEESFVNYKEYKVKPHKSDSSKKNYKDFIKKNIKITNIEILKEDAKVNENNSTISRESGYCKVFFKDSEQNSGVFLIDQKWRKNAAKIIAERFKNLRSIDLLLTKSDGYDCFLLKGVS